MRLTRIASLACCTALALMLAAAAQASLEVGVTEDAGKAGDGGAAFFATLTDLGLTANRVSIPWDAANPTAIQIRPRSKPGCRRPWLLILASSSPCRR